MHFDRSELELSRQGYEASWNVELAAIGANFRIEENVSDLRRHRFEAILPKETDLRTVTEGYFRQSVQGVRRRHRSSTFDETLNGHMLLPATIERNQKLVRLERIDDLISMEPDRCAFDRLVKAHASRPRDEALLTEFVDLFANYKGERPAFVAFKAELLDDLKAPDWLERMILELGLYHHIPEKPEETFHFALMEYTVEEVFAAAEKLRVERPFAIGTVLDGRPNPAFFPVPKATSHGFAVDLGDGSGGMRRELLHVRMDYLHSHVVGFDKLSGPRSKPDLSAKRDRHLSVLRRETGRADFGEPLVGGVP